MSPAARAGSTKMPPPMTELRPTATSRLRERWRTGTTASTEAACPLKSGPDSSCVARGSRRASRSPAGLAGAQRAQPFEGVDAGAVPVAPVELVAVASHRLEARQRDVFRHRGGVDAPFAGPLVFAV